MQRKRDNTVVHDDCFAEASAQSLQVFHVAASDLQAVLAVKAVVNQTALGIDNLEDAVRVFFLHKNLVRKVSRLPRRL